MMEYWSLLNLPLLNVSVANFLLAPTSMVQMNPTRQNICTKIQDQVIIKGKTWRSLDLAGNQSNSPQTTNNTNVNAHHNPLPNNTVAPSHYQSAYSRADFKNRRSSSEPANEQKLLLAHIQHSHMLNQTNNSDHSNMKTTSTHIDEHSQVDNSTPSTASTTERDEFIDIDCPHQKPIKVSEQYQKKRPKWLLTNFFFQSDYVWVSFVKVVWFVLSL